MSSQGQLEDARGHRPGSARVPALVLALLATLAPAALRAEPAEERSATERRRTLTAAEHLEPVAAADDAARPLAWIEYVHVQKGTGFEYRRRLRMGERPIELGVQGPVVRKKKSLGLTLVLRF